MTEGSTSPIADRKMLIIAAVVVLALAVGLSISLNTNKNDAQQGKVTKKEAAQAKKKGLEFYKQGKWDEALEQYKKAVSGNPKDVNARVELAHAYEQKDMLDDAYKQYEEILKINKDSADAHYSKGRILVQKKELDKAIAEFETAAKLNKNFTGVRADLANAYLQKKEYDKALATYAELEKLLGHDSYYLSRIYSAKGYIYKQLGQHSNAKAAYEKALELDKNNKDAVAGLK